VTRLTVWLATHAAAATVAVAGVWVGTCSRADTDLLTAQLWLCAPSFFRLLVSSVLPDVIAVAASVNGPPCSGDVCFCSTQGPNNVTFAASDECAAPTSKVRLTPTAMWALPAENCSDFADTCDCVLNPCRFRCDEVEERCCLGQMESAEVPATPTEAEDASIAAGKDTVGDGRGGSSFLNNNVWRWLGPVLGVVCAVIGAVGAALAAAVGCPRHARHGEGRAREAAASEARPPGDRYDERVIAL
jgi:hypothetical protein